MELSAWRDAVSFGAYLQVIRLQVDQSKSEQLAVSKSEVLLSQTTSSSCVSSIKSTEESMDTQQLVEASTLLENAEPVAEPTNESLNITNIAPFTCEDLNGGEQMALNVGGPVWAMDWLPSKPAANSAAIAGALAKSKQIGPQQSSRRVQTDALKGKENNQAESFESTAQNKCAEPKEDLILDWRILALATHPPCQVKDGNVVKSTPPDHYYDAPESGRNLIQIWAVPVQWPKTNTTKNKSVEIVKPRIVYAIDHESGVAWDLQWCPLAKKYPRSRRCESILGILAVCFGDGSIRVFEIPLIPKERLQREVRNEKERLVEKLVPIVVASLPRIMQLSVQWSPHSWYMLLTGGSDGSVSLWNINSAISESNNLNDKRIEPVIIEPQRRFQDADTIGKQEAFDWGCGWVAIRAVSWSPFDEHLFATTGNDSVFKVWDVREPRVCLRSHRIRSTWGLALQWMDQTSIQISGDQGSVYMYDILSGSYQKLHFHPQIDSPIWDLQFARRVAVPLLISACTSGSIRAAPAKKLYRAPQNCIELFRLFGEKDSSIEKPFKSLRVSFDRVSISGSADSVSQSTREFCERDAALHRLRLSSITPGDNPCFLAAGGHAGLVILFEMQEVLDTLVSTFFMPPSRKTGRPKKIFTAAAGRHVPKKEPSEPTEQPAAIGNAGRKAKTLGTFAKAKGMHTALSKYKKKTLEIIKGKARWHANAQKKSFIQDDGEVDVDTGIVVEDEPEFDEVDEDEEESDVSLMIEDNSDDDRISISSDNVDEEEREAVSGNEILEEVRLMKEYQLDLSEEDAILLAIEMSKELIKENQQGTARVEALATTVGNKDTNSSGSTTRLKTDAAAERHKKSTTPLRCRRRSNNKEYGVVRKVAIEMPKEACEEKQLAVDSTTVDKSFDSSKGEAAVAIDVQKNVETFPQTERQSSGGKGERMTDEVEASQNFGEMKQLGAIATAKAEKSVKRLKSSESKAAASKKRQRTATTPRSPRRKHIAQKETACNGTQIAEKSGQALQLAFKGSGEIEPALAVSTPAQNPNDVPLATIEVETEAAIIKAKTSFVTSRVTDKSNCICDTATNDEPSICVSNELREEKLPPSATPTVTRTSDETLQAQNCNIEAKAKVARRKPKKAATTLRILQNCYRKDDSKEAIAVHTLPATANGADFKILDNPEPARRFKSTEVAPKKSNKTATAVRRRRSSSKQGEIESLENIIQLAIGIATESDKEDQLSLNNGKSVALSSATTMSAERKMAGKRIRTNCTSGMAKAKKRKTVITSRERQRSIGQGGTLPNEISASKTLKKAVHDIAFAPAAENSKSRKGAEGRSCVQAKGSRKTMKQSTRQRGRRRKSDAIMTEEDAFILALTISKLEY